MPLQTSIASAEAAGLGHAVDTKIRKLSKGMAQLVQLLGSVVHQPDLLVLDEPENHLDLASLERIEADVALYAPLVSEGRVARL